MVDRSFHAGSQVACFMLVNLGDAMLFVFVGRSLSAAMNLFRGRLVLEGLSRSAVCSDVDASCRDSPELLEDENSSLDQAHPLFSFESRNLPDGLAFENIPINV